MSSPGYPDLTGFKALSFDCYGTLIDWEGGLATSLHPLLSQLPPTHPFNKEPLLAVERFNHFSEHLWASQPHQLYNDNLIESFKALAQDMGVSLPDKDIVASMGTSAGRWPAFPDTVEALQRLHQHFKLIILSNVSNENIARTVGERLAPASFDAVYTAENIGAYKPSHTNFRYLFEHAKEDFAVDFEKGDLLHVARSLTADHVPAKELGLRSVWIARGGDVEGHYGTGGNLKELQAQGKLGFEWKFQTLGEFADEVERQFAEKDKQHLR
jgi:2-haloalkanoic acid dehalogenase type II